MTSNTLLAKLFKRSLGKDYIDNLILTTTIGDKHTQTNGNYAELHNLPTTIKPADFNEDSKGLKEIVITQTDRDRL